MTIFKPSSYGWAAGFPQAILTASATASSKGIKNDPATGTIYSNLSKLSDFLGKLHKDLPGIIITSGYRSPALNAAVGGASSSAHMSGLAVDFTVPHMTGKQIATWLYERRASYPELDQVIWYTDTNHAHIAIHGSTKGQFLKGSKESGRYSSWSPWTDRAKIGGAVALFGLAAGALLLYRRR